MSGYRHGVLIHNFNEDQFGIDLQSIPKKADAIPLKSISHLAHDWKTSVAEMGEPPISSECVQRHLLLGHAGDMSDPRTNLSKTEFAPANRYFYQNPHNIKLHSLHADKYTLSDDPLKIPEMNPLTMAGQSVLARAIMAGWGDRQPSHALGVKQMYETSSTRGALMRSQSTGAIKQERYPRPYRDFTGGYDAIKIMR